MSSQTAERIKTAAAIIAVALVPVLVWYLSDFILIVMGAILVSAGVRLGAEPFQRWLRLPTWVALALSGMLIAVLVAGAGYIFGTRIVSEFQDAFQRIDQAQKGIAAGLQKSEIGRLIVSHVQGGNLPVTSMLTRLFTAGQGSAEPAAETGVYLSGGQWQRIAVARGLVRKDRDLLVLDEPSAGLDPEAEHGIQRALAQLRAGRTTLLISHRLSTVRDADRIVVLEAGKVAEEGSHQELLARPGRYADLFRLQASGYSEDFSLA